MTQPSSAPTLPRHEFNFVYLRVLIEAEALDSPRVIISAWPTPHALAMAPDMPNEKVIDIAASLNSGTPAQSGPYFLPHKLVTQILRDTLSPIEWLVPELFFNPNLESFDSTGTLPHITQTPRTTH